MLRGDVAEVTGRVVSPSKLHGQTAKFKATFRMVR
jgi:hypothetical protein